MNNINDLNIEDLRAFCRRDKVKLTVHALKRIRERKISSDKIVNAVLSGDIIEQYPDDKYYEKIIFNNGKIDLSDTECHISLIELLAFRYIVTEGKIKAEVRPINVSLPQ